MVSGLIGKTILRDIEIMCPYERAYKTELAYD